MSAGKKKVPVYAYDNQVIVVGGHFQLSGTNNSTVPFTGSTEVSGVLKVNTHTYNVVLKDKFASWYGFNANIGLLTGGLVSTHNLKLVLTSTLPVLTSSIPNFHNTGSISISVVSGTLGVVAAGAAIDAGIPQDSSNIISFTTMLKNTTGR